MDEHPQGHHNGTHAIIISMLVALMVVETATLGYAMMKLGTPSLAPVLGSKAKTPPIAYIEKTTPSSPYGSKVLVLDPSTGVEKTLIDLGPTGVASMLILPQNNYRGQIFADLAGEGGEDLYLDLYSFDLASAGKQRAQVPVYDKPIFQHGVRVSPDQTKIAFIPYNEDAPVGAPPSDTLYVFDLLTGKSSILGRLSEMAAPGVTVGYSFALPAKPSEDSFGTVQGLDFAWKNSSCVVATVYQGPSATAITNETFCEKE